MGLKKRDVLFPQFSWFVGFQTPLIRLEAKKPLKTILLIGDLFPQHFQGTIVSIVGLTSRVMEEIRISCYWRSNRIMGSELPWNPGLSVGLTVGFVGNPKIPPQII